MKKTTESVYRCDHCNKAMVAKGFMVTHERMCKKNPNNQHKCFLYCKHLIKEEPQRGGEEDYYQQLQISFTCALKPDIELYSYKLERFKSKADRLEGKERMPLECDLYEAQEGHYYDENTDISDGKNYIGGEIW